MIIHAPGALPEKEDAAQPMLFLAESVEMERAGAWGEVVAEKLAEMFSLHKRPPTLKA